MGSSAEQAFGGDWTEEKLECLRKYLLAYRSIFRSNARAQHFTTWYVDAFAGTGERKHGADEESEYREGSAMIALTLADPFDQYLFIEKSKDRIAELRGNVDFRAPALADRCKFAAEDANAVLARWCAERDWKKERAVVFLDPFGAQVRWDTVKLLAETSGVDLWYLFPLSAVLRMLKRDAMVPEAWSRRLTELLGTEEWKTAFYEPVRQTKFDFFEDGGPTSVRTVSAASVCQFLHRRLAETFKHVADVQLILTNSRRSPLFSFCFAASNPVATKIAGQILGKTARSR